MKRKAGKIVLTIIIIGMLGTILFWGFRFFVKNPFVKNSIFQKTESSSSNRESAESKEMPESLTWKETGIMVDASAENQKNVSEVVGLLPDDTNTYNIGESFPQIFFDIDQGKEGTINCRVNSVDFTKDSVDSDAAYYSYDRVRFDEEYNITNDYTYVVANVTFTNEESDELTIYVNCAKYVAINPKTQEVYNPGELQGYKTSADLPVYDKSYAKVTIPAGKEFECNLVYIQSDEYIQGKECYLHFNSSGITFPIQEDACYVRLNQNDTDI
ncbi:hypothetical protein BRYFOR_05219 [Marvinbryantia formatexigens DSM 14469]|uniref:DUF4352 domain-containing protein n=1 Tax=Marvinbryantia formatexigens DSM 14469 TaxID=478749 RepID=C6L9C9_9FIRM|nr:hypothetical protein [Marvinbryantia formatexigens]EET62868.1 hypothetical protein BRYFOR_05219 [Marvinbryantia formatexigens DSM 14469]UWO23468.1 hypothetical protein NQ534_13530 [Marvinbryantia formatexigens DSM 14469]SDG57487.1 hypothetical protein SAMN05660368_02843 [Marvinbryantia formatexigens]